MTKTPKISEAQLAGQREIMRRIREASDSARLAFVDVYGCQQNEADGEQLRGMLQLMGYGFTEYEAEADLILINTCAVREHAEHRVLGNIGHLVHTRKRGQKIAVCGCAVQQPAMREKLLKSYRHVDLIFGPHELWRFPELLERTLNGNARIAETREIDGERVEGLPSLRKPGEKAWLSVMYGCDNYCTYCVVPYVRGRERSRELEAVIAEARSLIESGVREIWLLGQNVNSYGRDLNSGVPMFPTLLRTLDGLPGEFTLHFRTSHPKDAGEPLFRAIAECGKVSRRLIHLPFQSGSDRVLAAMNRKYTGGEYLEKIERLRELVPEVTLSSDVIVGFPGETDEEFEDTLKLVGRVRFSKLFTFIYSPRVGTPAASMEDPATRAEKLARFDKLIALQKEVENGKEEHTEQH
ncbi:MAG: tRNA (N6-isopentenyl adenosine(37)-C2)-methylthiotransferase MiaB [Oscillospiraceae bacterium]|jgi:tRNA-2-methylthio-N6-dimethylallyladenosine synthase|nr:tRNA (N6-isopentenyl adenosine(37)-C2)-methylthiotransferase MiaB [Oscillospiraceae bacterium]